MSYRPKYAYAFEMVCVRVCVWIFSLYWRLSRMQPTSLMPFILLFLNPNLFALNELKKSVIQLKLHAPFSAKNMKINQSWILMEKASAEEAFSFHRIKF